MAKVIIGVMGPGEAATSQDCVAAEHLGRLVAQQGWITLTGGRRVGVMDAALRGAKQAGGFTISVLPQGTADDVSAAADAVIVTGMGEARNVINVLSSHIVLVCGMSTGTASEVALALKTERHTVLINPTTDTVRFWQSLKSRFLHVSVTPDEAIDFAHRLLGTPTVLQP